MLLLTIVLFLAIAFCLYCLLIASSAYDRELDDAEQEKAIKAYQNKKNRRKRN